MVIDHKGRILHASAKLANMLGHAATNLMKMELTSLLPQPICQMHGAWFKVRRLCPLTRWLKRPLDMSGASLSVYRSGVRV